MSDFDKEKNPGEDGNVQENEEDILIQDIQYIDGGDDQQKRSGASSIPDSGDGDDAPGSGEDDQSGSSAPEKENDEEDAGLEFISEETVKDKSSMAEGDVISGELVSEKKTKRRGVDETDAKREKLIGLTLHYKHMLIAAAIIIVIVIIAIVAGVKVNRAKKAQENLEQPISEQEYETDQYSQINELIENYYACYAEGDTDTILLYAFPMSENEMSYIEMYSEYLEGMENVVCYTKTGVNDGEYVVSVTAEWRYEGIETTAPGLDFFYVCTDENGDVYISNVYSTFNSVYQENSTEDDVLELIESYQTGDDVIALQASVQTLYEQALEEDEALKTMLEETLPDAISAWLSGEESESSEDADETEEETDEESSEETSDDSSDTSGEADASAEDSADEADESEDDTSSEDEITETESKAWMYTTEGVYIRESPSTDSEALASVNAGGEVRQLAVTSNGWSKVKSGDIVGYIKSEYLTDEQ